MLKRNNKKMTATDHNPRFSAQMQPVTERPRRGQKHLRMQLGWAVVTWHSPGSKSEILRWFECVHTTGMKVRLQAVEWGRLPEVHTCASRLHGFGKRAFFILSDSKTGENLKVLEFYPNIRETRVQDLVYKAENSTSETIKGPGIFFFNLGPRIFIHKGY